MKIIKNWVKWGILGLCLMGSVLYAQDKMAIVKKALPDAKAAITKAGVSLGGDQEEWKAVNQLSKEATPTKLAKIMVGGTWLGQNNDPAATSPFVDEQSKALSVPLVTIFQRMNEAGDMLRVATTVKNKEGKRAIGTYIPAVEPDGSANAVVSSVLEGKAYYGRALVVDQFCITGYDAITDGSGKIIGMIFVGVPEK